MAQLDQHMQQTAPSGGQACLLTSAGKIAWVNESWRRNGSPLPIAMRVDDNYVKACRSIDPMQHPDVAELARTIEQVLHGNIEFFDHEFTCSTAAGHPQHCLVRAQALAIDGKRCTLVSHEDVTDKRNNAIALRVSEQRYRQFFEASPDSVFLLSGSPGEVGRILDANTLAATSHGYTRDELLTLHIGDLDVPEDAALVQERIARLFRDGTITFQATHRRRDGSTFPVEVSARTTTIDGKPCVVAFNRDVTERQTFEDALRENQIRINLAARASRVGFWDWDLKQNSVYFSPEWKAQIGYEPDEIANEFEEWRVRVHPDDIDGAMAAIKSHIQGDTDYYTTEFRFRHKDGSYRWIFVRGAVSRDIDGVAVQVVGCHIDITAQKEAEAERSLLTQRLGQLQRLEAMGTLAGGIAHDFNNILSIISGNVELAMLETEDSTVQESLGEIQKASKRAGALVRQILSFSRDETPVRRPTPLEPIVSEAVRLVRSTAPQRIQIHSETIAKSPSVYADPEQLHQVMVNLGTNAWHAIGDGAGQVTFRLDCGKLPPHLQASEGAATDGDYAIIEIADDGEGMSEEIRSRIFEPFFTTKPSGKGTGLGLSVVHGIVSNHGGIIDISSQVGVGTTFRVYLPKSPPTGIGHDHESACRSGPGLRVLLVDDEPNLLRVLTRGLQLLGFEVVATEHPQHAIETLRAEPNRFDAFVTDFDMPLMNGITTAAQARAINSKMPILLSSGFMESHVFDEAKDAGVSRILTKPIMAKDLAAAIQDLRAAAT